MPSRNLAKPKSKSRPKNQRFIRDWQVQPSVIVPNPRIRQLTRTIVRSIDKAVATSTSAAHGVYGYSFTFNEIQDYASFAAVFDQYRFDMVEFEIRACSLPQAPSSTASYTYLTAAVDFDSSATPSVPADILSYETAIILTPGQSYTFKFVPHCLMDADASGAVAGVSKGKQWLDLGDPNIIHYGVRLCVKQSTSTNVSNWYCFARYTCSLRGSR